MKREDAALKRLESAHKLARDNGGQCLTTEPIKERGLFLLTCPKGHPDFTKRHDAVVLGKYCPACAMEKKGEEQVKYTKSDLDAYAANLGGTCLSTEYLGWDKKHLWQCSKGHTWESKPRMVISMGSWCPVCAGNAKYTVEDLTERVTVRGGKCLELNYDPVKERSTALWECSFDHTWRARTDTIIGRGDWCPHCKTSYGERMARQILEKLFDVDFPKVRPEWLMGDKGMPLEIDMFHEGLLGLEYQGPHHYKKTGYRHDSPEKVKKRDAFKAAVFEERPEKLIQLPEFKNVSDAKACIEEMKSALIVAGIAVPDRNIIIDYRQVYINTEGAAFFERLNAYVASHDGSLMSNNYIGRSKSYQVVCRKHDLLFTLNETGMLRGKWCPGCKKHRFFEKYKLLVENKGGIMLSKEYVDSKTPLKIADAHGFRFSLTSHQLSHGVWRRDVTTQQVEKVVQKG